MTIQIKPQIQTMENELILAFQKFYGVTNNCQQIFSPYRICPLGAHVDHQNGLVTGFAFDRGVDLLFSINDSSEIEIHSLNYNGNAQFSVTVPVRGKSKHWSDYPKAAVYALQKRFELKNGIKAVIKGNLPVGGLSSSAAVLVAYVMAISYANNIHLTKSEIVKITSEAEREFIGLNNGILDQSCVVLSEKDHLLYLDTDTNEYQLLPMNEKMPEFEIGVIFSGLTRNLVSTDYNLRVHECKATAWYILAHKNQTLNHFDETNLRDIPYGFYKETKDILPARFARRAEHFYSECERVKLGVTAWQKGDLFTFGKLIFESCESSINNYECGSNELIELYQIMKETTGIYGGRFSGAGFKGACICLIDPLYKEDIKKNITRKYLQKFPELTDNFEIHFCKPDSAARFVKTDQTEN